MQVVEKLKAFWQSLSEGLSLQQLWSQFLRETKVSYRLYKVEVGGRNDDVSPTRRIFRLIRATFWAMLLKLSPPRRIGLLVALVLFVWGFLTGRDSVAALGSLGVLALLGLELADRVAMKRDLQIAREIQSWLVPRTPPPATGVDVAFATRPANTVAGDYYDVFLCPSAGMPGQRLILVVADVAGKGMPAALLMATFQSSLRTLVQEALPLAALVSRLNRYCCDHSLDGRRFTTSVLAQLDCPTGTLDYVNAGHNPPALRRANGEIVTLASGGLPLGIQADASFESGSVTLGPGDQLLIYTDGVVDARDARGAEYGEARLLDLLRGPRPASAAESLNRLMSSVDSFTGNAPRFDDVTCVFVHYTGAR